MMRKAHEVYVYVVCVSQDSKNQRDYQKRRCSAVERKAMVRDEYRKRSSHLRPRACVMSMGEFARDSRGYRALFTRTYGTSSGDPGHVTMSVHGEKYEREGL